MHIYKLCVYFILRENFGNALLEKFSMASDFLHYSLF